MDASKQTRKFAWAFPGIIQKLGYHLGRVWLKTFLENRFLVRTALLALVGFFPTQAAGALGGLDCPDDEKKRLAMKWVIFED